MQPFVSFGENESFRFPIFGHVDAQNETKRALAQAMRSIAFRTAVRSDHTASRFWERSAAPQNEGLGKSGRKKGCAKSALKSLK